MPGQIWSVASPDPSGPLYVTSYGASPSETVVTVVDLAGSVAWQRTFAGTGRPRSRLSTDGVLWVAYPDQAGRVLEGVLPDGSTGRTVAPECGPDDEVGAFVLLDDGFCIAWAGASRLLRGLGTQQTPRPQPRVARYTQEGTCLWSTPIVLGAVSHPGVVGMGVETGWEKRPLRPWVPEEVGVDRWDPLLVSGDRVAAGFTDTRSGIGRTFFLDLDSGEIVSVTSPAPTGRKAIAGPGEFLIGSQGYGAFTTSRYDREGGETARWASHGAMLVNEQGTICGPELENVLPSTSRFRRLAQGNTLVDGPSLTGYYTSCPAMDREGTTVFWRDGKLLAVDADLALHELFAMGDDRNVMGRTLLLADGRVVVSLNSEVLVFHSPLGHLAEGPWPCGDANLRGNPVTDHSARHVEQRTNRSP
ncbi:hypothetical protein OKJ48_23290 [Streptomyces kunmingensis]|uniref:PQQ-like domain-containing protein n=1 Tax=Streptomyces kunmingensis TaxID=68225 RepID=A0ABU6CEK7_9ACTN|nr:hypothetical protein [Streptomyces kunmingensis]MEB3963145.1 hypothetical protein [Streptomyces kunmingensis]